MEFFNNKENEILKFKINSDGIDMKNIEPRLILITKENKNIFLLGELDNDICRFNIPELTIFEKGNHGKVKFEIISNDLYFPVWQDDFEIKSRATIKIEEMISEIQKESKSKPSISVIETKMEIKPEKVEIKPEKVEIKPENTDCLFENEIYSKLDSIFSNKIILDENEKVENEKVENEKVENEKSIMRFDKFKI